MIAQTAPRVYDAGWSTPVAIAIILVALVVVAIFALLANREEPKPGGTASTGSRPAGAPPAPMRRPEQRPGPPARRAPRPPGVFFE